MIGNQLYINEQLFNHKDNCISDIGDKKSREIIEIINQEYWKEWKRLLIHSEKPYIKCNGLGYFELNFSRAKNYIWKLIHRIQIFRAEGKATAFYKATNEANMEQLKVTWKQVNQMKINWIRYIKKLNAHYIKYNKPEKIRQRYE